MDWGLVEVGENIAACNNLKWKRVQRPAADMKVQTITKMTVDGIANSHAHGCQQRPCLSSRAGRRAQGSSLLQNYFPFHSCLPSLRGSLVLSDRVWHFYQRRRCDWCCPRRAWGLFSHVHSLIFFMDMDMLEHLRNLPLST